MFVWFCGAWGRGTVGRGLTRLKVDFLRAVIDVDLTEDHYKTSYHLVESDPHLQLPLINLCLCLTCLQSL